MNGLGGRGDHFGGSEASFLEGGREAWGTKWMFLVLSVAAEIIMGQP